MHHSSSSSSRILHLQIPTPKKFVHIQKLDSTVCKTQEVRSADKHIFYSVHSCWVTKQSSWILRLGLVRCICFPESKIGLQGLFQLKDWELGNYDFITHLKSQVIFFGSRQIIGGVKSILVRIQVSSPPKIMQSRQQTRYQYLSHKDIVCQFMLPFQLYVKK